ncbi:response regulator [Pedobacter quisquiliarum]|jgi:CheY-like chemotaxis protein|uniref:Response regulator n=1 Tax=Pedobacter quisquiliarum TaxID=1834438 RepID=A0A916XDB7_9SPHI|nr:response regulator [Pedobacter quisquiliarum]GGC65234.1 response regulator [Pedobacter quisquiliarum]
MKRVWLIDDDEVFVFLTKKLIAQTEQAVILETYINGQEAIDRLREISADESALPDLVLLDLNMPVMDGWEFLNAFQEVEFSAPDKIHLYIVTSSISPYEVERAKQIPAVQEFIVKPMVKQKFVELISAL